MRTTAGPRRLTGLDGLRAIAAILVVAYHASLSAGRTGNGNGFAGYGTFAPALAQLKAGVTIFFVISGLVIYLPFARALVGGHAVPEWRTYARRRIVRIVPAYWIALLTAGVLLPASHTFGSSTWQLLTFAQVYHQDTWFSGLTVAWSLDVEVAFYVAVPILAAIAARLLANRAGTGAVRQQLFALSVLGCAAFAGRIALSHGSLIAPPNAEREITATLLPMVFGWFVPGMILAVLVAGAEAGIAPQRPLAELARRPGLTMMLALCCFAVAIPTQHGDMFLTMYPPVTQLLLGFAAALLVLPLALRADRPGSGRGSGVLSVLESRPLAALGTVSFGIYLWHQPLLSLLRGSTSSPASALSLPATLTLFAIALAGACVIAALSWRFVERPIQTRARRNERSQQATWRAPRHHPVGSGPEPRNL